MHRIMRDTWSKVKGHLVTSSGFSNVFVSLIENIFPIFKNVSTVVS